MTLKRQVEAFHPGDETVFWDAEDLAQAAASSMEGCIQILMSQGLFS